MAAAVNGFREDKDRHLSRSVFFVALSARMAARPNFGSSARRSACSARIVGVLLASTASLAAAGPAKASVAPFSDDSSRTQRKLGYAMDDSTIRTAVAVWLLDATAAEATYGHISRWATGGVTDMSWLFCGRQDWMEGDSWWDDCVSASSLTRPSARGIPRASRAWASCSVAPRPLTKTFAIGRSTASRAWTTCSTPPRLLTKTSVVGRSTASRAWTPCSTPPRLKTSVVGRSTASRT